MSSEILDKKTEKKDIKVLKQNIPLNIPKRIKLSA